MLSSDSNSQFVEAARQHGMLSEELAGEVMAATSSTDVAATVVLKRGLMDARQVDMIQTLVQGHEVIPGYTILSIIGQGGMGVVFRARQEALGREVALKTILVGARIDDAIRRFRKEVKTIARLNHPNIVTAYDSGQQDGRVYLSMELVDGQDLSEYVRSSGRLPLTEALSITRQAAAGLAHAWEHGIVHRDIKPDNLLLTKPSEFDQRRTVKIADLGLAHLNADTDATRITQTGATVGTPLYMAPEQLGDGHVDCRSDIYSLGSTLYFMLTGQPPFTGDSIGAVLYNKAAGRCVPLSEIIDVNFEAQRLVESMMAVSMDQRMPDYRTLVSEIDRITGSAAPAVVPESLSGTISGGSGIEFPPPPADLSRADQIIDVDSATKESASVQAELSASSRARRSRAVVWGLAGIATLLLAAAAWYGLSDSGEHTDVPVEIPMKSTWSEPLFNGSSLDGWDQRTAGVVWEVATDPVEQAIAMSGTAGDGTSGSTRHVIPMPDRNPFFEVALTVLLDTASAAGIQFGMTEQTGGYQVSIRPPGTSLSAADSGEAIDEASWSTTDAEQRHRVRVRLQPTGWLVTVDGEHTVTVPGSENMLREIRVFVEGGRAFFTDLSVSGLEPMPNLPIER